MRYFALLIIVCLWSCSYNDKTIKVKGSDTEVNLAVNLAEHFYKTNKDFSVAISGGGSGLGIASLLNGQADIANSSRPLNDEEDSMFRAKGIALKTIIFAEDATAFIVSRNFPLDSIDIGTLANLLSGRYANWDSVTGVDMPVNIYGRQSNSGTHSFVRKKLKIEFSPKAKEMNGNAQIIQGVKMDVSGIGYVGAGYLMHIDSQIDAVKILKIIEKPGMPAISPLDETAIKAGRYYFQRPLYQFIPTTSWNKVSAFIAFERSEPGQKLIAESGYYIVQRN